MINICRLAVWDSFRLAGIWGRSFVSYFEGSYLIRVLGLCSDECSGAQMMY